MHGLFDIHCHIIPGVDDGSKSLEESIKMLEMEYKDGIRNIILTPHFRYDMFEASEETVQKQYARLVAAGQRLLAIIKKLDGLNNKDTAKFADQVLNLCDKWDPDRK